MIQISGYETQSIIFSGPTTSVYDALCETSGEHVFVKINTLEFVSDQQIARLNREFEFGSNLLHPNIVKYRDRAFTQSGPALIVESFSSTSLADYLVKHHCPINQFLILAEQLCKALKYVHHHQIIHKAINPHNILISGDGTTLKLTNFGYAIRLRDLGNIHHGADHVEPHVGYISPEQSGRINRSVDSRSDLYSLGCTFYHMLTGHPPFRFDEPHEVVHAHIAAMPIPLQQLQRDTPASISELVEKLLNKDPSDRYQNIEHVLEDIEYIIEHWQSKHSWPSTLPSRDISADLIENMELFGRHNELDALRVALESAQSGQKECWVVDAPAGCGKTTLLTSAMRLPTSKARCVALVDCRSKGSEAVITSLFNQLFKSILSRPEGEVTKWRQAIKVKLKERAPLLSEISANGRHLLTVPSSHPSELPTQHVQQLLLVVMLDFLELFAELDQTLVLAFDNADCAEAFEKSFLQSVLNNENIRQALVICSTEDASLECIETLTPDNTSETATGRLHLAPFSLAETTRWLSQLLHGSPQSIATLATSLIKKTDGNPLFLTSIIKQLRSSGIIQRDQNGHWRWSQEDVDAMPVSGNVAELLSIRFSTLPPVERMLLSHAAVYGRNFSALAVAQITDTSVGTVDQVFTQAIGNGILIQQGEYFSFSHEHIRQAAYQSIEPAEVPYAHQRVGHYLISAQTNDTEQLDNFDALEHLNQAAGLLEEKASLYLHARRNLAAAKSALNAFSLNKAEEFISAAISVLPANANNEQHRLWYDCNIAHAEILQALNKHDACESVLHHLIASCNAVEELIKAKVALITLYTLVSKSGDAIFVGREALHQLGYDLPANGAPDQRNQYIDQILKQIATLGKDGIDNMPPMSDSKQLMAVNLIEKLIPACVIYDKQLYLYLSILRISIPLQHGLNEDSATGFAAFAGVLQILRDDYENAKAIAQIGVGIDQRFSRSGKSHRFHFLHAMQLSPWYQPLEDSIAELERTEKLAMEVGDIQFASYAVAHRLHHLFYLGTPCTELETHAAIARNFANTFKNHYAEDFILVLEAFLDQARYGINTSPSKHKSILQSLSKHRNASGIARYATQQALLCIVDTSFDLAHDYLQMAEEYVDRAVGTYVIAEYHFLRAFTHLARQNDIQRAQTHIEKLSQWSEGAPSNFYGKHQLLLAEYQRAAGNHWDAAKHYDQAIIHARQHKQYHLHAITAERFWRFWQQNQMEHMAEGYLKDAFLQYQYWGLEFKTKLLAADQNLTAQELHSSDSESSLHNIDYLAVNEATQAISSEMHLDALFSRILEIVIHSAGAQCGAIVIENNHQLTVEASYSQDASNVSVLNSVPLDQCEHVPNELVRYVFRTGEEQIFQCFAELGEFADDSYYLSRKPKSIMCVPIRRKQHIIGALYLENLITSNAFTSERLDVLEILTTQAAISLENSLLYRDLTEEIGERILAERTQKRFTDVLENTEDLVLMTDAEGKITYINSAGKRMLMAQGNDVLDQHISTWIYESHQIAVNEFIKGSNRQNTLNQELMLRASSGETINTLVILQKHLNPSGQIHYFSLVAKDISEIKKAERRLWQMANYDGLTLLPNRVLFKDQLENALTRGSEQKHALLFLDLDNFKHINDSLGHPVGDELLISVAETLTALVPSSGTVARLGGDEFAILLAGIHSAGEPRFLAEQVLHKLSEPLKLSKHEVIITPSMGIALCPEHGTSPTDLLRNADTAMFNAKRKGRNTYEFFEREMNDKVNWRLSIESELRKALENNEFTLHYQSKVHLPTQSIVGAEALIRWNNPLRGMVSPSEFIPIAEETGLIIPIGEWVLETACTTMAGWLAEGKNIQRISVNLSARQFIQPNLIKMITSVLERTGLPNSCLELEITEGTIMEDLNHAVQTMTLIKEKGINLSIDDFGTGYSSLNYLKKFPLDTLKIDRSFVVDMCEHEVDRSIALSIIELAHNLNMNVVAEGAETKEQVELLRRMNCDIVQGFYFSRPIPAKDFSTLLDS